MRMCLNCGYPAASDPLPARCSECGYVFVDDTVRDEVEHVLRSPIRLGKHLLLFRLLPLGWWWALRTDVDSRRAARRLQRCVALGVVLSILAVTMANSVRVCISQHHVLIYRDLTGKAIHRAPMGTDIVEHAGFGSWVVQPTWVGEFPVLDNAGWIVERLNKGLSPPARASSEVKSKSRRVYVRLDRLSIRRIVGISAYVLTLWALPYLAIRIYISRGRKAPRNVVTAVTAAARNSSVWLPLIGLAAILAGVTDILVRYLLASTASPGPSGLRLGVLFIPCFTAVAAWTLTLLSDRTGRLFHLHSTDWNWYCENRDE